MAKAVTERFDELKVEVEFDPTGSPGVYVPICGIIGATVNRTLDFGTTLVPNCTQEGAPLETEKEAISYDCSISGTGVWARSSQSLMKSWIKSGQTLNTRVSDAAAASGDVETETGPALCTAFNTAREKGQKVSQEINLEFSGTPEDGLAS